MPSAAPIFEYDMPLPPACMAATTRARSSAMISTAASTVTRREVIAAYWAARSSGQPSKTGSSSMAARAWASDGSAS